MDSEFEGQMAGKLKKFYDEINRITFLLTNFSVLRGFPEPFESEFQENFFTRKCNSLRIILFFGMLLYSCYSIVDYYTLPNWQTIVMIRLVITTPLLLIILSLCFTPLFKRFHQLFAVLFAFISIIGLTVCAALVPVHYKDLFYQSLSLVAFFLAVLTALQFRYTVIVCISLMAAFNISYYFSGMNKTPYYIWGLVGNNYILFGSTIVCAAVSYFNEINLRNEFLLNLIINLKNGLLDYMSRTDELTGLPNRRQLEDIIPSEWNRALRYHYSIAIIFADFDFFKQYNDTYGHQAGDKALRSVGLALSTCVKRAGDYVARYGGDEFMAVLSNSNLEEAVIIAKNIMDTLKKLSIKHKTSSISDSVTLTIGIAVMKPTLKDKQQTLIKQADLALQKGKISKRNHIYVYTADGIKMIEKGAEE